MLLVVPDLPTVEDPPQLAGPQQMVGRPRSRAMGELGDREGLVDHETAGPHGAAQRRPERALQVVGADQHVEPVAGQGGYLEVRDPESRRRQAVLPGLAYPPEVAVDAVDPEP